MKRLHPGQRFELVIERESSGFYVNLRLGGSRFQVYVDSYSELRGMGHYILQSIGDEPKPVQVNP